MNYKALRNVAVSAITTLLLGTPALAQTSITGCSVLSAPGPYTAPGGSVFTLTGPGDCVVIAGPNITFTADSLIINGPTFPPGGTGIHILPQAIGAVVTLTGNTQIGTGAGIQALTIGIEDDAATTQLNIQGSINGNFDPTGGTGFGIYLNNANSTSIVLSANAAGGGAGVEGATYGLVIVGGAHNSVVSGLDSVGGEAGGFDGGTDGILSRNSNHNVINHVTMGGGGEGFLADNSPGNTIYNNGVQGGNYGIRLRWNSPNNYVVKNLVMGGQVDLYQGTHPNTVGCNGDYWADNAGADLSGNPAVNTSNQGCVLTMQAMTAY